MKRSPANQPREGVKPASAASDCPRLTLPPPQARRPVRACDAGLRLGQQGVSPKAIVNARIHRRLDPRPWPSSPRSVFGRSSGPVRRFARPGRPALCCVEARDSPERAKRFSQLRELEDTASSEIPSSSPVSDSARARGAKRSRAAGKEVPDARRDGECHREERSATAAPRGGAPCSERARFPLGQRSTAVSRFLASLVLPGRQQPGARRVGFGTPR